MKLNPATLATAKTLRLTTRQAQAVQLLTKWEGVSVRLYCHRAVLSLLDMSFGDLEVYDKGWAADGSREACEAASRLVPRLKPLSSSFVSRSVIRRPL